MAATLPAVGDRSATCIWQLDADLLRALDERFGPPVDSYVNGTQTWLTDDGPGGITLEWRLHPVTGFRVPKGMSHYELWDDVLGELADPDTEALQLGVETRTVASLWEGLECFAAYGDDIEPAPLASAASEALGRAPDASGLVDHEAIGREWEHSPGSVSLVALVLAQLRA